MIKKLDLIGIGVKNDEVGSLDSGRANKTDKISAKFKNIKNLSKKKSAKIRLLK